MKSQSTMTMNFIPSMWGRSRGATPCCKSRLTREPGYSPVCLPAPVVARSAGGAPATTSGTGRSWSPVAHAGSGWN